MDGEISLIIKSFEIAQGLFHVIWPLTKVQMS
jgi:hypothetical protein